MDTSSPGRSVGVTATRKGLTAAQKDTFRTLVGRFNWLHDGDCKGGDSDAWYIARSLGLHTVAHPCDITRWRAFNPHEVTWPVEPALVRNHDIVDSTLELIACPKGYNEELRGSGTWATIRYARKSGKPLLIIWPDGTLRVEYDFVAGTQDEVEFLRSVSSAHVGPMEIVRHAQIRHV